MSLLTRLQQYIGANATNAAEALNASAKIHFRLIQLEDISKLATQHTVPVAGLTVSVNDIILSVHNGSRQALLAEASQVPELNDSDSMNSATILSPRYYYLNQKLYTIPSTVNAKAYLLSVAVIDMSGNEITWLPNELEEASIIRAAIVELQSIISADIDALNFDFSGFVTSNEPTTPTITDVTSAAVTGDSVGSVIDASNPAISGSSATAASITKPNDLDVTNEDASVSNASVVAVGNQSDGSSTDASNDVVTVPAVGSLPTLGSFGTITKNTNIGTLVTALLSDATKIGLIVDRIKLATADTSNTGNEAGGNISETLNSFAPTSLSYVVDGSDITATTGTDENYQDGVAVPSHTKTTLSDFTAVLTNITNRLADNDDTEVAAALTAQANTLVQRFQSDIQNDIQSHQVKLDEFRLELERQVRNVEGGFKDRELDLSDRGVRVQFGNLEVAQNQAGLSSDQLRLRAEEVKSNLERANEELKLSRNQLRSQDRAAEFQGLAQGLQARNQAISSLLAEYRADVDKANAEFQGVLTTYSGSLQGVLQKFDADVRGKLQDSQLAVNVNLANASAATQVTLQNKANELQRLLTSSNNANQIAAANLTKDIQVSLQNAGQADSVALSNKANELQILVRNSDYANQVAISNAANTLQAAISEAQAEAAIEQANMSKDLELIRLAKIQSDQLRVVSAANDLQAKVANTQTALTIFNAEAQIYGQNVGLFVQNKSNELQAANTTSQININRVGLLRQLYQDTLMLYTNRGLNAQAPTQDN